MNQALIAEISRALRASDSPDYELGALADYYDLLRRIYGASEAEAAIEAAEAQYAQL